VNITAIVLAAGQGSRFRAEMGVDQDKLLADCTGRDGAVRPVIEQVLLNLPAIVKRWLVTTPEHGRLCAWRRLMAVRWSRLNRRDG
jgi:molybdenum cofactor cytidylyltransferase